MQLVLSGDEAVARGALDAGISGAFAYPGTPSTEIMEYVQDNLAAYVAGLPEAERGKIVAQWCSNEKTAYESALGASFAGARAIVSMKHVGLNVAMDPFTNSALVRINGGLVIVVADDPSMHSSQDEQDSRVLADFARVPCFEPSDQQEAYTMIRQAFGYSEQNEVPVLMRLTTRLSHARAMVQTGSPRLPAPKPKSNDPKSWILMPAMARGRWKLLLEKNAAFRRDAEAENTLQLRSTKLGVIACGLGLAYYLENETDWVAANGGASAQHSSKGSQRDGATPGEAPSLLRITRYPIGHDKIRQLAAHVEKLLVIEEGYPFVEREIRGVFGAPVPVMGKLSGEIPLEGELTPESVRLALGLPAHEELPPAGIKVPGRPPQFCQGCPHADSISALQEALAGEADFYVASDIGCYTLSALPPYRAVESCVDMGASIGMARGASCVGQKKAVAVIGDSTFYHSGMTNLLDAVSHKTTLTLLILDNSTTGMTGAQPTISPTSQLPALLQGLGVERDHIHELISLRKYQDENAAVIRSELAYEGVSVIILKRECLEYLKKARKA
ncbi:MAG: thiamine pyrophosphate-dependent enzyme [Spirochaetaceae bacterium]|nr:thiamine pyrophosphate-dependent enzyme [Spirochaetaceae bacterium]